MDISKVARFLAHPVQNCNKNHFFCCTIQRSFLQVLWKLRHNLYCSCLCMCDKAVTKQLWINMVYEQRQPQHRSEIFTGFFRECKATFHASAEDRLGTNR